MLGSCENMHPAINQTSNRTGFFALTVPNSVGNREYFVTMTGSNGQQVNRSWTIQIVCPDGGFTY